MFIFQSLEIYKYSLYCWLIDFTEGGSLSVIVRIYLCYLIMPLESAKGIMYDKKLSKAQKTVESEPQILTDLRMLKLSFLFPFV